MTAPNRYERSANEFLRISIESQNRTQPRNHRQRRAQDPRRRRSQRSANPQNLTRTTRTTIPQVKKTRAAKTKAKERKRVRGKEVPDCRSNHSGRCRKHPGPYRAASARCAAVLLDPRVPCVGAGCDHKVGTGECPISCCCQVGHDLLGSDETHRSLVRGPHEPPGREAVRRSRIGGGQAVLAGELIGLRQSDSHGRNQSC